MKISTSNDIHFIFEFPLYFWPAKASAPIRILHISNIWTFCNFYSGYIDVCSECMLYSFEHSLPHVGRKSVFLFMYLLHVLIQQVQHKNSSRQKKPHFRYAEKVHTNIQIISMSTASTTTTTFQFLLYTSFVFIVNMKGQESNLLECFACVYMFVIYMCV